MNYVEHYVIGSSVLAELDLRSSLDQPGSGCGISESRRRISIKSPDYSMSLVDAELLKYLWFGKVGIVSIVSYVFNFGFEVVRLAYNRIMRLIIRLDSQYYYVYLYYMISISRYLIIPLYGMLRLYINSIDVIHSLGIYSLGIKVDAVPGRVNLSYGLRSLVNGEYRGYCYELCGSGHCIMLIVCVVV